MEKIILSFLLFAILPFSCTTKMEDVTAKNDKKEQIDSSAILQKQNIDTVMKKLGLVDIQTVHQKIQIELKYATKDNFVGKILYENLTSAYLQKDVATRLAKVQDTLEILHPGYSLRIYDGVRPVEVQQKMWDALDTIPISSRIKFVSNPKNRSLHNFGAAVDLTIVDSLGNVLDMGAGYDDIRKIAYPRMENYFLQKGELIEQQITNRKLLRKVMRTQKFKVLQTEWWHFNACSRWYAKAHYEVLLEEPNPEIISP